MTDRCTGHCCKNFSLPLSPDELQNAYRRWLATQGNRTIQMTKEGAQPGEVFTDLHLIAPMVIYLGPKAKSPRYVNSHEKGPDVHRYRCKHWDSKTQDCTIYEIRPLMCREYPGRDKCNFAACTWESNKRKKRPAESLTGLGKVIEKVKLIGEK